jgi:hypothetical protein
MFLAVLLGVVFQMIVLADTSVDAQAQAHLETIVAKLSAKEIERVDILEMPSEALTRTRVTPEMLEAQFWYKLTINHFRGGPYEGELLVASKSLTVRPQEEIPDLRWAAIFYDTNGIRVGALYFNNTGSAGAVDTTPVLFQGSFFNWLNRNFSECFR